MRPPTRRYTEVEGVVCHERDGQKTRGPSTETTAGTRVTPASHITATPITRPGAIVWSEPSSESPSAEKAMITTKAAKVMTSPTFPTACTTAS